MVPVLNIKRFHWIPIKPLPTNLNNFFVCQIMIKCVDPCIKQEKITSAFDSAGQPKESK